MARLYVDKLSAQATGVAVSITDNTVVSGALTATSFNGDLVGNIPDNSVTSAKIVDGAIVNADVNASAAIDYSKLATLADGNILVGNGSGVATSVNPSGDIDISNTGAFSIASGVIVNADVNNSAAIARTKLANVDVVDDTSPQLGGDLDVQSSKITTATSNGNVKIELQLKILNSDHFRVC